jgi:hypothetical protein
MKIMNGTATIVRRGTFVPIQTRTGQSKMKNVPDNRDPNKVWYLHVNGKHHSEYENLQNCIVNALVQLQTFGNEIAVQTRQQWLEQNNLWEEGYQAGLKANGIILKGDSYES